MWCDSTTDSIVWMGEGERSALSVPDEFIDKLQPLLKRVRGLLGYKSENR